MPNVNYQAASENCIYSAMPLETEMTRRASISAQQKKDDHEPITVVLTGGPSSGKSTALAILKDRLSVRGLQVLTVPENATHLMSNSEGFQPYWAGTDQQVEMQRIFMEFQMDQEKAFRAFAKLNQKRSIILLDRSLIDTRVFISDKQWEQVKNLPGRPVLDEAEMLSRYDVVTFSNFERCKLLNFTFSFYVSISFSHSYRESNQF